MTAKTQRNRLEEPEKNVAFAQQLLPRLKTLPGVRAAAVGSALPLEYNYRQKTLVLGDGPPLPVGQRPQANTISISPERIRWGRNFGGPFRKSHRPTRTSGLSRRLRARPSIQLNVIGTLRGQGNSNGHQLLV
jgi:hypothetical protein